MATVFQRCKSDQRSPNYPCVLSRCGHDWTVRYRGPGGRTARQREKTFPKKTLADHFAAQIERDKDTGTYLDPKRGEVLLRLYATEWLERQVIGESTYRNYESFLRIHLAPRLGDKPIAAITRQDIEEFVVAVRKKIAASTLYDRMKMVGHIFSTAVEEKRIAHNPSAGVKLPRIAAHAVDEDEIPSLHEVELIAKEIAPQYRLTVYLQAGAGLRISETLACSTECRRDGFLRVRWQVSSKASRQDCRTRFVPLKHRVEGEYRDVPIPPFLEDEIDAHLADWGTLPVDGQQVMFAPRERGKGTMPTASTYGYHFQKALNSAGMVKADGSPMYTPHCLRHFFASTALANGVPIHEVSRWLGHKSIKTTVDVYGHLVPAAWDRCRDIMQRAMRPGS